MYSMENEDITGYSETSNLKKGYVEKIKQKQPSLEYQTIITIFFDSEPKLSQSLKYVTA